MSLVKVKRFAQVTIPADIRRRAHIEPGDFVEMTCEKGKIIMTPKRVSDKTVDWERKFDEALAQVRKGVPQRGLSSADVDKAVRTARRRSR
ncbi:MAG: AbrB/MazE/SpoVT family DNA-binding domain-containing protein [Deltaproteobacteria bacterium]|nr:AbrB/MazE/SpoVT family DNA-binding domain-containing protein [Deltaproteobacteria bacterium]